MESILSSIGHFLLVACTFLLIFSVLIILHELGHFWMARLGGVRVEEFGFGLPPKIWSKKTMQVAHVPGKKGHRKKIKEEMEWSLNAIPFGGFVRMRGEESDQNCKDDPRAFCNRPLLWRMAIVLAGVAMNFFLAFFLFTALTWHGFDPLIDPNLSASPRFQGYFADGHVERWVEQGFYQKRTDGAFVIAVEEDSPAARAGLISGDQITALNETSVGSSSELQELQQQIPIEAQGIEYTLKRFLPDTGGMKTIKILITPEIEADGKKVLGVVLVDSFYYPLQPVHTSLVAAPGEAFATCKRLFLLSAGMVKTLFNSTLGKIFHLEVPQIPSDVGGPVAIANTTKQLVEIGNISKIIQFAAVLSLSLAVINLVPFPALDGGRFFFLLLEGMFFLFLWPVKQIVPNLRMSHRIPSRWEMPVHVVGYALLLLFIVAVTWKDVLRILG